ncbi:MAG: ribonuclease J [Calditerrivibrio sp.]|nr:ribonuclease J [Calditerrivibrio sp.]
MEISVSFLGGAGEIGSNCYLYETKDSAILVDCGLKFFQAEYMGIDFTIPSFEYLETIRKKLKAVIVTHGHEDHIGALPYLFKYFPIPVYAGDYALRLIKHKIAQSKYRPSSTTVVSDGDVIDIDDFTIEFIEVNHSIPNTFFLAIRHKNNQILHCGDFRVEDSPILGAPFPWERLNKMKGKIDILLVDSTNALSESEDEKESELRSKLIKIFQELKGRVFITTFSTNISRVKIIIDACLSTNRKLIIEGNSFLKNINIARDLSYISIPEDFIIPLEKIDLYEPKQLCFLVTGCQGEPNSSLAKIVNLERKKLRTMPNDTFIFSSTTIPGNEKSINKIINEIYLNKGKVIRGLHISGHANRKWLITLIKSLSPRWVIPIHGEIIHQRILEEILEKEGLSQPIFVQNGHKVTFKNNDFTIFSIPFGVTYIDQRGGFEYNDELFKEKKHLSRDGLITILYDEKNIYFDTAGFKLTNELDIKLKRYIKDNMENLKQTITNNEELKTIVTLFVRKFFKKNLDKRPVVKVFIKEDFDGNT